MSNINLKAEFIKKFNNNQDPKHSPNWAPEDDNKQAYKNFFGKAKNTKLLDKTQANPERLIFFFPVLQPGKEWCPNLQKFAYEKCRPCAGSRYHNAFWHPTD